MREDILIPEEEDKQQTCGETHHRRFGGNMRAGDSSTRGVSEYRGLVVQKYNRVANTALWERFV